jgi:polyhydroxybutyrate depolymerase
MRFEERMRAKGVLLAVVAGMAVLVTGCSTAQEVYVGRPALSVPTESDPAAITPAVPAKPGVAHYYSIPSGGVSRRYRLHLPVSGPSGPRPLVIAFHDSGSSPDLLSKESGLDGAGDRNGVIIAYPQGIGGTWNNGFAANVGKTRGAADVALVASLIRDIAIHTRLDELRVTVAGIGDGAVMALRVAAQSPGLIVGAAAIEGGLIDSPNAPRPTSPVSLLLTRSTEDPRLPWSGTGPLASRPQLGAQETTDIFRVVNRLPELPVERNSAITDRDPGDGAFSFRTRWVGGKHGSNIVMYKIDGAGGPWPGGTGAPGRNGDIGSLTRDFSAASVVVQFAIESRRL